MDTGILTMDWRTNAIALFNTVAFELYSVVWSIFIVLETHKIHRPLSTVYCLHMFKDTSWTVFCFSHEVLTHAHTRTHAHIHRIFGQNISKGFQVCFLCVHVCTSLKQHNRCWSTCLSCTLTTWGQLEDSGCEAELVNTGHRVSWVTHTG